MKPHRKNKLIKISLMMFALSIAMTLILYALRQNISLYYTPSQLTHLSLQPNEIIRIGGFVKNKSVKIDKLSNQFEITDFHRSIKVIYRGLLPALFREKQGVVVQGVFSHRLFIANEVLAKHGTEYHPK